jgi:hypothetical protein
MLIVDDERYWKDRPNTMHARSVEEAKKLLQENDFIELSLDHDLGEYGDIRPLIPWLIQNAEDLTLRGLTHIYAHTMNPVGANYITFSLEKYFRHVQRINLDQLGVFEICASV